MLRVCLEYDAQDYGTAETRRAVHLSIYIYILARAGNASVAICCVVDPPDEVLKWSWEEEKSLVLLQQGVSNSHTLPNTVVN